MGVSDTITGKCVGYVWEHPTGVNPLPPRPQGPCQKGGTQLRTIDLPQKLDFVLGVPFQKFFTQNFQDFFMGYPLSRKNGFAKNFLP